MSGWDRYDTEEPPTEVLEREWFDDWYDAWLSDTWDDGYEASVDAQAVAVPGLATASALAVAGPTSTALRHVMRG